MKNDFDTRLRDARHETALRPIDKFGAQVPCPASHSPVSRVK